MPPPTKQQVEHLLREHGCADPVVEKFGPLPWYFFGMGTWKKWEALSYAEAVERLEEYKVNSNRLTVWDNHYNKCWFNSIAMCAATTPALRYLLTLARDRSLPYRVEFSDVGSVHSVLEEDEGGVDPDVADVSWSASGLSTVRERLLEWIYLHVNAITACSGPRGTHWYKAAMALGRVLDEMMHLDEVPRYDPLFALQNMLLDEEGRQYSVAINRPAVRDITEEGGKKTLSIIPTSIEFLGSTALDVLLRGITRTSSLVIDWSITSMRVLDMKHARLLVGRRAVLDNIMAYIPHEELCRMKKQGKSLHRVDTLRKAEMCEYLQARCAELEDGESREPLLEELCEVRAALEKVPDTEEFRTQNQVQRVFFARKGVQESGWAPMPLLVSQMQVWGDEARRVPLKETITIPVFHPSVCDEVRKAAGARWSRYADTSEWRTPQVIAVSNGRKMEELMEGMWKRFQCHIMFRATYKLTSVQVCRNHHYVCYVTVKCPHTGLTIFRKFNDLPRNAEYRTTDWPFHIRDLKNSEGATFFWQLVDTQVAEGADARLWQTPYEWSQS